MKFSIKAGDLIVGLQKTGTTVDTKDLNLGTNGVLFDVYAGETNYLYLYSTDMLGETVVKLNANIEESGQVVLDPVYIQALLLHRNPDELVNFSLVKSKVDGKPIQIKIKIGKNTSHIGYSIKGVETLVKRMKTIPFKNEVSYNLDGKYLTSAVKKLSFCTTGEGDQTKYILNGIALKSTSSSISFTATNGLIAARYLIVKSGVKKDSFIIVPVRSFSFINKLVNKDKPVDIINTDNKLYLKINDNVVFGTNLLTGKYPAIDSVLNDYVNYQWVSVNKEEFKQVLDRMSVFDSKRRLQLEFTSEVLKISVHGSDGSSVNASDEIALDKKKLSEDIDYIVSVNLDYVHNILNVLTNKEVIIGVKDFSKSSAGQQVMFLENELAPVEKDEPEGKQVIKSSLLYTMMPIGN